MAIKRKSKELKTKIKLKKVKSNSCTRSNREKRVNLIEQTQYNIFIKLTNVQFKQKNTLGGKLKTSLK